jgi:cobalt-zinc-cadmium efflux system outer membrane protein
MGIAEQTFTVQGTLDAPLPPEGKEPTLIAAALERRRDLHARRAALDEAEARLRLQIASRYGNPNVGPAYEYDPTRINLIGVQFSLPIPVFNTHRGEILQRQAERARAALDLRNNEVVVQQEVRAALGRLHNARAWAATYRGEVLPNLERSLKDMEALFAQGGVPVLSVIDLQRKLLRARDGYLDALYELRQAQADLAYAVSDPGAAITP